MELLSSLEVPKSRGPSKSSVDVDRSCCKAAVCHCQKTGVQKRFTMIRKRQTLHPSSGSTRRKV